MNLHQIKTSFGRALTDGCVLICDALPLTEDESKFYNQGVKAAAEWLWDQEPAPDLAWPASQPLTPCPHTGGLAKCKTCRGSGETTCHHCGTFGIECEDCDGEGKIQCDCVAGFQPIKDQPKAVSLGDHRDANGHPVGISTQYVGIVENVIGPVKTVQFATFFKSKTFCFIISGERGKAVVMPYRMTK